MKKIFYNILSFVMIILILVFSSGIHIFMHHCLIDDATEVVFLVEQINCDHHEISENSCCDHNEHNCTHHEKHNCDHSHLAVLNVENNFDEISFSPITCEFAEYDLILDKNNISQTTNFNIEEDYTLLLSNYFQEIFTYNIPVYKDILLTKMLYSNEQPVLFTGIETIYLFHCPKIPSNHC